MTSSGGHTFNVHTNHTTWIGTTTTITTDTTATATRSSTTIRSTGTTIFCRDAGACNATHDEVRREKNSINLLNCHNRWEQWMRLQGCRKEEKRKDSCELKNG